MRAKARLFGHPIHQMLIVFPLGLLGTSLFFDIAYLVSGNSQWALIAYWMIVAGILSALVAAVFGLIDWLAIPAGTRAKRIGALHGGGNLVVVLLFAEEFADLQLQPVIAGAFLVAIGLIMWALLLFLRETREASAALRIPETYLELERKL